jgi:hypothetical protein
MNFRRFFVFSAISGLFAFLVLSVSSSGLALAKPKGPNPPQMYVSVRRYDGVPDTQKAARVVSDTWIPIIAKVPGFISYYWVDAGNGVMISTSVFDSRQGAEESNRQVKQWRVANPDAASALPNPPQISAGQVVGYKSKLQS